MFMLLMCARARNEEIHKWNGTVNSIKKAKKIQKWNAHVTHNTITVIDLFCTQTVPKLTCHSSYKWFASVYL